MSCIDSFADELNAFFKVELHCQCLAVSGIHSCDLDAISKECDSDLDWTGIQVPRQHQEWIFGGRKCRALYLVIYVLLESEGRRVLWSGYTGAIP